MKFFCSFGYGHEHHVIENGESINLDVGALVEVEASDPRQAHDKMCSVFGKKWAMLYTEDRIDMRFFPRGVLLRLVAA